MVLARRGFRVTATDTSEAMLGAASRNVAASGEDVELGQADWLAISQVLAQSSFDAVLCTGNSIAHLSSGDMQAAALCEFAALLKPGGLLVVDTHNWEHVIRRGDRVVFDSEVLERDGWSCKRTYRWNVNAGGTQDPECRLAYLLEVTSGVLTRVRQHRVSFVPFTVAQLLERTRRAGLGVVYCDAETDRDRYTLIARRP